VAECVGYHTPRNEISRKKVGLFFSINGLGNNILSLSGLDLKHGIDCHNIYVPNKMWGGLKCQVEFSYVREVFDELNERGVFGCVGGGPHRQVKEIINKEEKIKVSAMQCNAKQRRRGWGSVGSVLSYLSPPPNTTYSQTHTHSLSNTTPTTTPKATTTLAFVAFCCCASYAIVYVCCFCSLFSVPSNGGGIIL